MERKWVRRGLNTLALLGVLAGFRALVNHEGTNRALDALIHGERVSCIQGYEGFPIDAIAAFGGGVNEDGSPNSAGRKRLDGVAKAYLNGEAPVVALVGDVKENDESFGKDYLVREYDIPAAAVVVGRNDSINTATDAARLVELAHRYGWKRVRISDSDSHKDRSTQFTCYFGLAADSFAADDDGGWNLKEAVELMATTFDPDGWGPTILKRITLRR